MGRLTQFDIECDWARRVFEDRNQAYGDAITETGVLGACVELVGCVARLKELVLRQTGELDEDAVRNVLQDAHNYANIGLIMLQENNWRGR